LIQRSHAVRLQPAGAIAREGECGQVYVPDDVLGGGERAVLEARCLGVKVEVEPDNPKLVELLTSPIYDHTYYARRLLYGLQLLDLLLATQSSA
jgi:hypothetical protein